MLSPHSARIGPLSCGWLVILVTIFTSQSLLSQTLETPVSGALTGDQTFPSVGLSGNGGWVVWEDNFVDGKQGRGIAAVSLDSNLASSHSPIRINQQMVGDQEKPQVQILQGGNALVIWESRKGPFSGVVGRIIAPGGSYVTGDFVINTPAWADSIKQTTNWTAHFRSKWKSKKFKFRDVIYHKREQVGRAAVVATADGGALVAYQAVRSVETNTWGLREDVRVSKGRFTTNALIQPVRIGQSWMQDVFIQKLDANGQKVGPENVVSQTTDFNQRSPSMTVLSDGSVLVAWVSESQGGAANGNFRIDVVGRKFNAQGEPLGDEFLIGDGYEFVHANPVVVSSATGFMAFWSRQESVTSRGWDVYGASFDLNGTAQGPAFRVNSYTRGNQFAPRVAVVGENALVVWTSVDEDGSREGVFGRFLSGGALAGDAFRLNDTTIGAQQQPAVAADAQGRFHTVWSSFVGDSGYDLFGKILIPENAATSAP